MKTEIKGGYVVAFDENGHKIIRDGVVVFEGSRIVHVGKTYDGEADRTIDTKGKLVSPGFINAHATASINFTHFRLDGMRAGLRVSEAYVDGAGSFDLVGEDLRASALFCIAELLKGGSTTILPTRGMAPSRWEPPQDQARVYAKTAGELGARAYVPYQYRSGVKYWTEEGAVRYNWDEEAGRAALERGLRFKEEFYGAYDDRIRTMLASFQFDACSESLLRRTKEAAREHDLMIFQNFAQSLSGFHSSLKRYGKTPVRFLSDIGFLDSKVILAHAIYTTLNPVCGYPRGDTEDIELLAESGATVAHSPVVYSRSGRLLHSFGRYLKMGVNMGIGTDTFPMDMIREMRWAAIMGKVADRDPLAVTARDVFDAATLGGAKALGRDDLGRLTVGAKADIVVVDLTGLLIDDPVKSLIYMASQQDIETVIVDGKILVEEGGIPELDEKALARKANDVNQQQKMAFVEQNPMGLSVDEFFPPSFLIEE